jgi:hypothetical protein
MGEWAPSMPDISRLGPAGYSQQFVRIDLAAAICECSVEALLLSAQEVQAGKFPVSASRVHLCNFTVDGGSRQFTHVAWMVADGEPEPPRPARLDDYGPRSKPLSVKRRRQPPQPYETGGSIRDRKKAEARPSRDDRQALFEPLSLSLSLSLLLLFCCCCFCCL